MADSYMLQDLAKVLSLTQYTKIKMSQPNSFFFKQAFILAFFSDLTFVETTVIFLCNSYIIIVNNVGKYQYHSKLAKSLVLLVLKPKNYM